MPEEKKLDPFKPQQPAIPGVSAEPAKKKTAPQPPPPVAAAPEEPAPKRPPIAGIVAGAGAFLLIVVGLIVWSRGASSKANAPATPANTAVPNSAPARPSADLPVGPGPVATTEELAKPWSSKRFLYRNPTTSETQQAMVVRLPGGEFWGFSLKEPFGNCELEYISSIEKLQTDYGLRASHPMVANPCNRTVYDLTRYGPGGSDEGLVRGEIVQGNGIRPPLAIEIRVEGKQVVAARIE